jgi:hypothetical protein
LFSRYNDLDGSSLCRPRGSGLGILADLPSIALTDYNPPIVAMVGVEIIGAI